MEKAKMLFCRSLQFKRLLSAFVVALLCIGTLHAEPITVTGTVTSASDGEPLIGVSVVLQGQNNGVTTDFDGVYTIKANIGQTLVFSYVGMETQSVKITGSTLNVVLKDNAAQLDELVVVGYGVQKKKLVTGATVQMKGDDVARMNTNNALQAMQGQTPGVSIQSTSGQPGADMKVSIRGLGTIGSSGPLYLIDGIAGDVSSLNPADIESIDVLKDAASAAIYGAQAANGVVLVTTKSGKEGKTVVSFDAYYGWQSAPRKMDMLNAEQYMIIQDEQQLNSGLAPYDWANISAIWNRDAEGNPTSIIDTNWVDEMFKTTTTESYTLGLTGGNANSNYAMSLGYMNQGGIVGGPAASDYSRYNFRINSEHKLFNGIVTVGEQVGFVYKKNHGVAVGHAYYNTLRGAYGQEPLTSIYDVQGNYMDNTNSDWNNGAGNPYGDMMINNQNRSKSGVFTGNVYAQINPMKGLAIRTVFGSTYGSSDYRSYSPIYQFSKYAYRNMETVSQSQSNWLNLVWTNTASYDWKIRQHEFNALIGMEIQRSTGSSVGAGQGTLKEGYSDFAHAWVSNGTGTSNAEGLSASGQPNVVARTVSYFGRLGWNWKETYMINFTLRNDGSSKFARGHRHGWFPSVSAGWTISNESFMEDSKSWLDFLKLRASWGRVGNQNIANFQYLSPVTTDATNYWFGNQNYYGNTTGGTPVYGQFPARLATPGVTWETSEQTNVGLDMNFLGYRLQTNVDFYIKKTKDWLVQAPILATAGTGNPVINGGDVTNKGIEFNATWRDRVGEVNYWVGGNFAYNHNEVGSIPTEDGIIHGATGSVLYDNSGEFYRAQNGHAIGYFWGYQTAGIFQNEQQINDWVAAGNGIIRNDVQPGDVIYVDQNRDGYINEADKIDLGNGLPSWTYGFNFGAEYKHFDISATFTGAAGNKIVQALRNHGSQYANYTTEILGRWTGEGTSNRIPRVTNNNLNYEFSDLFIHDGDYLRIANITLGYDFAPLMKQKWCSQARLYFQVQNLHTFTKYNGLDPEIGFGNDGWVSGIDYGYYPRPRTFLLGVNLKF